MSKPTCEQCNGRGSILVPIFHHDFGPGTEVRPCPTCHPTPNGWVVLGGLALVIVLLALAAMRGCS